MANVEWATESPTPRSPEINKETAQRAAFSVWRFLRWHLNRPLMTGGLIVLAIVTAALLGPQLAPHDPLAETNIIQVGETWITPPFPAFKVPGYPLGSDAFGRDLFSRLLWAIRPTMTMVLTVAGARLLIGVAIGLISGWSASRLAQALRTLTSASLSVPILIVALVAIAAIGVEWGIWAFVIGLSITGWAESAQVIREKTRELRNELFIEAGRALGANPVQILIGHVLRHVMPMVWMLLAFEISSTLMVTASLGFLGYFIGGDVWIEIGDFVARRVSGAPELGQMLATSHVSLLEPWGMFAVGTVIFTAVLGFNLLGEGLRRRLALTQGTKRTLYGLLVSDVLPWLETHITRPCFRWTRAHPLATGALILAILSSTGAVVASRFKANTADIMTLETGPHLWATDYHDAYGTLRTDVTGPTVEAVAWTLEVNGTFGGGPSVAADGTLYLSGTEEGKTGALYAVNPNGTVLWTTSLMTETIGTPALGQDGKIYIADVTGSVTAISPAGEVLWRTSPAIVRKATSGPIIGPDGTIYLGYGSNLQALTPEGESVWEIPTPYGLHVTPPHLSADGQWLFRQDLIVATATGEIVAWPALEGSDTFPTGLDGRQYARAGNLVLTWALEDEEAAVVETTRWDSAAFTFANPRYNGVTADRVIWLVYTSLNNGTAVWLSPDGRVYNRADTARMRHVILIGLDDEDTAYLCGVQFDETAHCFALSKSAPDPIWQVALGEDLPLAGGAIVQDRLYVTTQNVLFALGE